MWHPAWPCCWLGFPVLHSNQPFHFKLFAWRQKSVAPYFNVWHHAWLHRRWTKLLILVLSPFFETDGTLFGHIYICYFIPQMSDFLARQASHLTLEKSLPFPAACVAGEPDYFLADPPALVNAHSFLAVQDSSITDIVCPLVGPLEPTNNQSLGSIKEWP